MSNQASCEKENSADRNRTQRISIKNVTKLTTFAKNIPIGTVVPMNKDGQLVAGRTPLEELRQWKNTRCSEAADALAKLLKTEDIGTPPPKSEKHETKKAQVPATTTKKSQIQRATPANANTEPTRQDASIPNDPIRRSNDLPIRNATTQANPSPSASRPETRRNFDEEDLNLGHRTFQTEHSPNPFCYTWMQSYTRTSRTPKETETPFNWNLSYGGYNTPTYLDSQCYEAPRCQIMKELQFMSNPSGSQSMQALPGIGRVNGYTTPTYSDLQCYEAPRRQTMKEIQFMSNPSGNQSVQALPGIGRVNGERLSAAGYGTVSDLQRRCTGMSEAAITNWMTNECGVNRRYASTCAKALSNTSSYRWN